MTHAEGLKDQGSYKPCNLVAGEYPRIERIVTIAAGANLSKGSVLGRITADGKFVLSATASSNGSEVPDAILAEVADATSTDVQAVVYFSGEFNENALVLGTGHTPESIRTPLRAKSIFLSKNQSA
jgi:hypothetical protein